MSNRLEHVSAGFAIASITGCASLKGLTTEETLAKTLGMLAGSFVGSRTPDWIEPPVGFNHWGPAHSRRMAGVLALYVGALAPIVNDELAATSRACFEWDRELASQGRPFLANVCWLLGLLFQGLAGFAQAFPVAYATHLGMDQATRKSDLPW